MMTDARRASCGPTGHRHAAQAWPRIGLTWVNATQQDRTPTGSRQTRAGTASDRYWRRENDGTLSGLGSPSWRKTQPSAPRTAGLHDGRPLGVGCGTKQESGMVATRCQKPTDTRLAMKATTGIDVCRHHHPDDTIAGLSSRPQLPHLTPEPRSLAQRANVMQPRRGRASASPGSTR